MNRVYKLPLLGVILLLFYSCTDENGSEENSNGNEHSPYIIEARAYFEQEATKDVEFQTEGLHPGNIAPEWDKATIVQREETVTINVPLITEATYEGAFPVENEKSEIPQETYYTAIYQRLIVVKSLEHNDFSCYIASIIPDEGNATQNRTKIEKMLYCGDPNTLFCGTVIYSTLTSNYTIAVEKYQNGTLLMEATLFNTLQDMNSNWNKMEQMLKGAKIKRKVRTMTKNGEFGGCAYDIYLNNVTVTGQKTNPTPPPSLPSPPDPPFPSYTNPSTQTTPTPTIPPPTSGNNKGNSGNKPSSNTPNIDKLYSSSSTLNSQQKSLLEKAIVEIKKNQIFAKMLADLEAKNIKIIFKMNPNLECTADFCANTIRFQEDIDIRKSILTEELIHAVQYNLVYTKTEINDAKNRICIEFEAHIFDDVANFFYKDKFFWQDSKACSNATNTFKKQYIELINEIKRNRQFDNKSIPLFYQAISEWGQYGYNENNSFTPKALIKYIKY